MNISKEILKGSVDAIVLATLRDQGASYGYQLIQRIKEQSLDVFDFQEGTIYPLLYRLEDKGFVKSKRKKMENGKTRRYYEITSSGLTAVQEKEAQLKELNAGLHHVFGWSAA